MSDAPHPPHAARDASGGAVPIRVVGGSPTDEETAAIAALFSGLLLERSIAEPLPETSARTAWDRTRRSLRAPWPTDKTWQDR